MFPQRPMLASHALARRHHAGGREQVVVHDERTGALIVLGVREWTLLSCADGTRDLRGILRAAARAGAHATEAALVEFLSDLHRAGLIEEGTDEAAGPTADEVPADRPLDVLPFSLRCDGSGTCCRFYPSIVFSPVEVARARSLRPEVREAGMAQDRGFTPERGAPASSPCGWAVALEDGRCSYLGSDGRCSLHSAGGPEAKPLGCRLFPATFVDDGEAVRVSAAVECACVLASVGGRAGTALVPGTWRTRSQLPEAAWVRRLPARVAMRPGGSVDRNEVLGWSRRALADLPEEADGAAWLLRLADEIEREGRGSLSRWFEALAARAARRARDDGSWRSDRDPCRATTEWVASAAQLLSREGAPPCENGRIEAFYARAVLHGHHAVSDELPLSQTLRDRAVRLLAARAMARIDAPLGEHDPATAWPLALVEALLRAHGLSAYVHDVTR